MIQPIKIAIVDDHALLRQGLASILGDMKGMEITALLSSGEEAVNLAAESPPDIFLMDIIMRGMTGIEATRWIKENNPSVKIILVSSEVSKDFISAGVKTGIDGYLPKDVDAETLVTAIRTVMNGERYFSPEVTSLIFKDFYHKEKDGKGLSTKKIGELSKREVEVLIQIAEGKSVKEIADMLFISVKTVETHKVNIKDKLGLSNTAQLVKFAIENNLIQIDKKA